MITMRRLSSSALAGIPMRSSALSANHVNFAGQTILFVALTLGGCATDVTPPGSDASLPSNDAGDASSSWNDAADASLPSSDAVDASSSWHDVADAYLPSSDAADADTVDPCTIAPTIDVSVPVVLNSCTGVSSQQSACMQEGLVAFARLPVRPTGTYSLSIHAPGTGSYFYFRIFQGGGFQPSCRGVTGGGFTGPDVTVPLTIPLDGPLCLGVDVARPGACGGFTVTLNQM